jgi:predicted LPLAT superfamily acyltransferase
MAETWKQQRERGAAFAFVALIWVVRLAGRRAARLILYPTVAYYLLTAGAARRASRDFLRRVLPRAPGLRDVFRHLYTFAAVMLDRLLLLGGWFGKMRLTIYKPPEVIAVQGSGCVLLVAHFGNFETKRGRARMVNEPTLRIVMDRGHGRVFTQVLERLNPEFAASIIDASQPGPTLALEIKQALDAGCMIGLMADRARPGERTVTVDFLGGPVRLPAAPWILAGVMQVPVVIAFGLYRGSNRYDAHLELFADRVQLPRAGREAAIQAYAQRYADRMAHYARLAPYNWFNFYDYWADSKP